MTCSDTSLFNQGVKEPCGTEEQERNVFQQKHAGGFSTDLNNPFPPEAVPGDAPLHLQGLHTHQKS